MVNPIEIAVTNRILMKSNQELRSVGTKRCKNPDNRAEDAGEDPVSLAPGKRLNVQISLNLSSPKSFSQPGKPSLADIAVFIPRLPQWVDSGSIGREQFR